MSLAKDQGQLFLQPVRLGLVVLVVIAIANSVYLYFWPHLAATDYAWRISPPINAAFIGAGFLSGLVSGGLGIAAVRYWRSLRGLVVPFFAISAVVLAATLLHADRFRWDFPLTWAWLIVYALLPFGAIAAWLMHERTAPPDPPAEPRLNNFRLVSGVLGALLSVGALLMFIRPEIFIDVWPWQITPLMGRVFAGWYLLIGSTFLFNAFMLRRAHEAVIPYALISVWAFLLFVLPFLHMPDIRGGASLGIWLLLDAVILTVAQFTAGFCVRLMRDSGQRL